jgi:hypothetical protein
LIYKIITSFQYVKSAEKPGDHDSCPVFLPSIRSEACDICEPGNATTASPKFVQVPVPLDLKEAYGGKRYVEKYLRGDGEILKNQVYQEVALIFSEFEVKRGRGKSISIAEEKARREATRSTFEWLLANASSGPNDLSDVLPIHEGDGGQPIKRIKEVLLAINEAVPESEFERIGNAITDGDFDALALFKKGLRPSLSSPKHSRSLEAVIADYFAFVSHDASASWTKPTDVTQSVTILFNDFLRGSGCRPHWLTSPLTLFPVWLKSHNIKSSKFVQQVNQPKPLCLFQIGKTQANHFAQHLAIECFTGSPGG